MRTLVVTLSISLLASMAPAAQTPDSPQSRLPTHSAGVRVDFGLAQARMRLPPDLVFVQPPSHAPRHELPFSQWRQVWQPANPVQAIDCAMVKAHRRDLLSVTMPSIKPPSNVRHHLKVVPVTPCPVR